VIISKLFCGLGNQMFQYAGGVSLGASAQYGSEIGCFVLFNMQLATRHFLQQYAADCFVLDAHFAAE